MLAWVSGVVSRVEARRVSGAGPGTLFSKPWTPSDYRLYYGTIYLSVPK